MIISDLSIQLNLRISDPEVVEELSKRPEGLEREQYALTALRLGIISMKYAAGQLDSVAIKQAGDVLMADIRELLLSRGNELTNKLTTSLTQYFDPQTGSLTQRLHALIQKDGELERILATHLGADDSVLAQSLAKHVGKDSPVFAMLSPTEANGVRAQIAGVLGEALADQRKQLLTEFSLDNKESALSRLVNEVVSIQTKGSSDTKEQIDLLMKQFSLDHSDSALSRLVLHVEGNLTLDNENSALFRIKREMQTMIEGLINSSTQFYGDVRERLAALEAKKQEQQRSTRHGSIFEEHLGQMLVTEAQRLNDIYESVGATTGAIKNCKIGDFVINLGPDSIAPDARIVWEAKEDRSYDIKRALSELEQARKNRQAQIGVFVFSMKTVPENIQPFARYDNDIIIAWNADESLTDIYVNAAYTVARALVIRHHEAAQDSEEVVQQIELATRQIEKQINYMDDFKKWGETVKGHGENISSRAEKVKRELMTEVEKLDKQLLSLKLGRNTNGQN